MQHFALQGMMAIAVAGGMGWGMTQGAEPARLPAPPAQGEVASLVEKIARDATANTTPASRERIAALIAATAGPATRLYNHAGILLVIKNFAQEALWCFAEAARKDLKSCDALSNMALILSEQKKYAEAEKLLLYVSHTWPDFPYAYINLGRVYGDQGKWDLVEACTRHVNERDPGRPDTESMLARRALSHNDMASAARHIANLAALDPEHGMLPKLVDRVPEEQMRQAITNIFATAPLRSQLVDLPAIPADVTQFVHREMDRPFWRPLNAYVTKLIMPSREEVTITPEVWDQLPENVKEIMRRQGTAPGNTVETVAPGASRAHYYTLSRHIHAYEMRFIKDVKATYTSREILKIVAAEGRRQAAFKKDYFSVLRSSQNPHAAAAAWSRQAMPSLERTHQRLRGLLAEAREDTVARTIELWHTVRTLIGMVPTEYFDKESEWLVTKVVNYHNQQYVGSITAWFATAMRVVAFEDHLNGVTPQQLHQAAARREFRAWLQRQEWARQAAREAWERWRAERGERRCPWILGPSGLGASFWVGINTEVFALQVYANEVKISGGEGIVGSAVYNFDRDDLTLGLGVGVGVPLGPGGSVTAKELGVVRFDDEQVAFGLRTHVEIGAGTPVAGAEIDVVNNYCWLTSVGW